MLYVVIGVIVGISFIFAYREYRQRFKGAQIVPTIDHGKCILIEVPTYNEKDALAAEQMFASLHGLLNYTPDLQEHLSFEITSSSEDGIKFYMFVSDMFRDFAEGQVYAQYPDADLKEVEDYTRIKPENMISTATEITLARENFFPIRTFLDFEVDPLAAITSAIEKVNEGEKIWIQLLIRPVPDDWQEEGYKYIERVREGKTPVGLLNWLWEGIATHLITLISQIFLSILSPTSTLEEKEAEEKSVQLSPGQEVQLKAIEEKLTKNGFEAGIRFVTWAKSQERTSQMISNLVATLKQFSTANLNAFQRSSFVRMPSESISDYASRLMPEEKNATSILNTAELASLFHLPHESVETPTIAWSMSKRNEPPLDLPTKDMAPIGQIVFRNQSSIFGIKKPDRRQHIYIIGKTGTGKSTLEKNMIIHDLISGEGVGVIDPHGDLIEELLNFVPKGRLNDVVLFDPGDRDNPVALNMLEMINPEQKNLMASGLVSVFKKQFGLSWGPRLEYILRNCFLTLLEIPNTTLLAVPRLLTDRAYEQYIVEKIKDPVMKAFWNEEFAQIRTNNKLLTEAISPIQNKVGQFLASETIRNIVGQAKSTVRVDEIINSGKILFVNLSKGKIGEDNSNLLGSMLISRLQFAAMNRVNIPENERRDFYLYVDEFQNFATESFNQILSEARKYRLNLTLAHQYIKQLPIEVQDGVFGNVGTVISFTVGPEDAAFLARQFAPIFEEEDMLNLKKHHIYIRLLIDGQATRPFSAVTLKPSVDIVGQRDEAIRLSNQKYAGNRNVIEDRIARWSETKFKPGMSLGVPDISTQTTQPQIAINQQPIKTINPEVSKPAAHKLPLAENLKQIDQNTTKDIKLELPKTNKQEEGLN